jgi:hypothetical protein
VCQVTPQPLPDFDPGQEPSWQEPSEQLGLVAFNCPGCTPRCPAGALPCRGWAALLRRCCGSTATVGVGSAAPALLW